MAPYKPWMLSAMAPQGQLRADEYNAITQRQSSAMRNQVAQQQLEADRVNRSRNRQVERDRLAMMADKYRDEEGWREKQFEFGRERAVAADERAAAQERAVQADRDRRFGLSEKAEGRAQAKYEQSLRDAEALKEYEEELVVDPWSPGTTSSGVYEGPPPPSSWAPDTPVMTRRQRAEEMKLRGAMAEVGGAEVRQQVARLQLQAAQDERTQAAALRKSEQAQLDTLVKAMGPEAYDRLQLMRGVAAMHPQWANMTTDGQQGVLLEMFPGVFAKEREWAKIPPAERVVLAQKELMDDPKNWEYFKMGLRDVNEALLRESNVAEAWKLATNVAGERMQELVPAIRNMDQEEQAALVYAVAEGGHAYDIEQLLPALKLPKFGDVGDPNDPAGKENNLDRARAMLFQHLGIKWDRMKRHRNKDQWLYLVRLGGYKIGELFSLSKTSEQEWDEAARRLNVPGSRFGPKIVGSRGAPYTGGMLPQAAPVEPRDQRDQAIRQQINRQRR